MGLELAHYDLDEPSPITMTTLSGDEITVVVHALDTDVDRLELHGEIAAEAWPTVESTGAFHIDLEPNDAPGGDDPMITVVLVLRDPLRHLFDDAQAFVDALFADRHSVVHDTEAWLLASALQSVAFPDEPEATASVGFRTSWASPIV